MLISLTVYSPCASYTGGFSLVQQAEVYSSMLDAFVDFWVGLYQYSALPMSIVKTSKELADKYKTAGKTECEQSLKGTLSEAVGEVCGW